MCKSRIFTWFKLSPFVGIVLARLPLSFDVPDVPSSYNNLFDVVNALFYHQSILFVVVTVLPLNWGDKYTTIGLIIHAEFGMI